MSKLPLRAQTVDIAYLPLRQDLLEKNVLMTAQRDYGLGNSLFTFAIFRDQTCFDSIGLDVKLKPRIRITVRHFFQSPGAKGTQKGSNESLVP